jgi:predicted signal transduction protein with EAL and GGDEF domain
MRTEDVVARLGGDEFVVLLPLLNTNIEEAALSAKMVAEKIRKQLCKPYVLNGNEYNISSSIGIVLFPNMGRTLEDLIKYADAAMYQAKAAGRNQASLYQEAMRNQANQRLLMENEIHQAMKLNQFDIYYHPQYDATSQLMGVEALLRWNHPTLGVIPPNDFIPIAEETGIIIPISRWVLSHVCHQLNHEQRLAPSVSINISARHFRQSNFVDDITNVLAQTGFAPERLKLEITETVAITDIQDTLHKIDQLQRLGVEFSMDDFGTGYASLSYLSQLPINQLKIDRSFIARMTDEPSQEIIVDSIIAMARSLGMEIIAEGVENETQLHLLLSKGCDAFQGFFYTKPLPFEEYRNFIQKMTHSK